MLWGIWAIVALLLLIAEIFTVDFTFLMLAGGALGAMVISFFTQSWIPPLVVFALLSVLLLFFVRPLIKKHVNNSTEHSSNVYALVGQTARALTKVNSTTGRVKIGGDVWSARSAGDEIDAGVNVVVMKVSGAYVVVEAAGRN